MNVKSAVDSKFGAFGAATTVSGPETDADSSCHVVEGEMAAHQARLKAIQELLQLYGDVSAD